MDMAVDQEQAAGGSVWKKLELGVCYYPEHWDESYWAEDLRRMKELGLGTVRIAEFAWNKFEPEEGKFTFEFFDRFLEYAEKAGIRVIFGTPTATPPAWLTQRYPESLNARTDGVLLGHGARRHYNYNSPKYRELTARIVEKLGEHYGQHPCIVGWQIDNELNCETAEFHSESDQRAFRSFLKEKYGTLEALNEAWGTAFWNQDYTDWDQIRTRGLTVGNSFNPHQRLDYLRFVSRSAVSFCRLQSDILRRYIKPGDFITTNGMFGHLDNHRMTEECLDTYMYDSYPDFAYALTEDPVRSADLNDRKWSRNLTEARSICPHFGIMEQQSGANGWNDRMEAPAPKPGQMMLWTMQSIAHGADYVSYFRWRTCRMGTEIYWHGILDYDSRDNRRVEELRRIRERVEKLADLAGASYVPAFGLVKSYDNNFDAEADNWHGRVQYFSETEIFCGAQLAHTPFDIVYLGAERQESELTPEKYPLLFYPHGTIVTEHEKEVLENYVRAGGTLCIGCRSGYKDECGRCVTEPMPGLLRELAGGNVREFTWVRPEEPVKMIWRGRQFAMPLFNDVLEAESARVLGTFAGSWYEGRPALLEHVYGKGRVLYLGGVFTRELVQAILEYVGAAEPWADVISAPECCELAIRRNGGQEFLFVLNYSGEPQTIVLKRQAMDVDDGIWVTGETTLKGYGTKVYRL